MALNYSLKQEVTSDDQYLVLFTWNVRHDYQPYYFELFVNNRLASRVFADRFPRYVISSKSNVYARLVVRQRRLWFWYRYYYYDVSFTIPNVKPLPPTDLRYEVLKCALK